MIDHCICVGDTAGRIAQALKEKGYDVDVDKTHSYLNNDIVCTAGGVPNPDDKQPLIAEFIETHKYTTEEKLINLCDMVSWIIAIIYMIYNLKLKFELPYKESLNNVIKYGVPTSLERLLSRIFILIYGVIASHLGTD